MIKPAIEEYAEHLSRKKVRRKKYAIKPAGIPARLKKMKNVAAVLWDVYGTLLALSVGDLERALAQKDTMRTAFRRTIKEFGFGRFLDGDPPDSLMQLYVREIENTHRRKRSRGVFSPEVKIEHIWLRIIRRLAKRGYRPDGQLHEIDLNLAFRVAYFFDDVYQAKILYPGARETLECVRELEIRQGVISNAQFYTPVGLRMLFRRAGVRDVDPMKHFFDRQLVFFSYALGVSKPNPLAFERARSRLEKRGIESGRVLYVGNDVLNDMMPAREFGFKCVLFAGDKESLALRKERPECKGFRPDAVITSLSQLLEIVG